MRIPAAIREAYRAESRLLCRQAATTICLLGIPLVPAFAVLDRVVFPERFAVFLQMRLVCTATLAAVWWLLRRPFGARHPVGLGVVVAVDIGLMIDVMTMSTGGHASPYYAGVNLVILAIALVMPWRPEWTAASCALLIGGYVACALAAGPITNAPIFASNLFFLTTTALIAVVATAVRESLRRREFANRQALTAALRHKDEFLAKMTHELRTPIHVMIGYADILLEEGAEPAARTAEARPLIEGIRRHGVLLHGLVSDLLDYAKVEAGKMEVRRERVAVQEIVERVAESFRPLAERKGLGLLTTYQGRPPTITSDGQKIQQILTNLVGNALKFTDRGAITIEARAGRATDAFADGMRLLAEAPPSSETVDGVVLTVQDTGVGIRAEHLGTLAADFQQLDAEAAARHGGTGLGLSISKKLTQLLGGGIAVRTRYGNGSTFAVFVPSLSPTPLDAAEPRRSAA